jgi:hypothetical protein
MVGGLLGMLGFVLAFTFSMASSQHDNRKQNVLNEVNAIGTAYLRADLVDDEYGLEVKRLLRDYVDTRLGATNGSDFDTAVEQSVKIHKLLWSEVSAAALATPDTNSSLMIQAINTVIDMHEQRITGALRNRIPASVWIALGTITALTMIAMGIQVGLAGKRRLIALIPLSFSFAVLLALVVDLNRPQNGLITISQESMITLQKNMLPDA